MVAFRAEASACYGLPVTRPTDRPTKHDAPAVGGGDDLDPKKDPDPPAVDERTGGERGAGARREAEGRPGAIDPAVAKPDPAAAEPNREPDRPSKTTGDRKPDRPSRSTGDRKPDRPSRSTGDRKADRPSRTSGERKADRPTREPGEKPPDLLIDPDKEEKLGKLRELVGKDGFVAAVDAFRAIYGLPEPFDMLQIVFETHPGVDVRVQALEKMDAGIDAQPEPTKQVFKTRVKLLALTAREPDIKRLATRIARARKYS